MDEARMVAIYRETVRPLYAAIGGWTRGDRGRTEDIVQETYLRAVRTWRTEGVPERPLAWLRTVARNLVVSEARRRRPRSDSDQVDRAVDPGPPLTLEEGLAVEEGLGALPTAQARLLRAFHGEGLTTRELARRQGISERAVEGRLRRARLALGRLLNRTNDHRTEEGAP